MVPRACTASVEAKSFVFCANLVRSGTAGEAGGPINHKARAASYRVPKSESCRAARILGMAMAIEAPLIVPPDSSLFR